MTTSTRPVALLECPLCGTDWDPNCPRATGPAWDPTGGVQSEQVEERIKAAAPGRPRIR